MALRLGIPLSGAVLIGSLASCSGENSNVYGGYHYSPQEAGPGGSSGGGAGGKAGASGTGAVAGSNTDASSTGGATNPDGSAGTGGSLDGGKEGGSPGDGSVPSTGHALGEPCTIGSASGACRAGLACTNGTCAFTHTSTAGTPCVAAGECASGLTCALGVCATAGTGAEGAGCTMDTDCQAGLRCALVGFSAACAPEGSADVGQACTVSGDCLAGLLCAPSPSGSGAACAPIPTTGVGKGIPFGLPTPPPNLGCEAVSTGRVDAHFEVPGAQGTTTGGDFFRLPFPNDARIQSGTINLDGFPTPGSGFLGFDPVKIYVDSIVANESAWGPYPTVLFRFSGPLDFNTLKAVTGQPSPVQFPDITPGNRNGWTAQWGFTEPSGKYICHDWLGVRRAAGDPLEPGHTYAVLVTTAARDANGLTINRSPQFAAMLSSTAPTDAGLANAYAAYKPLRDYLTAQSVDPNTILTASVFTVGPVRSHMTALATAVNATPIPTASGWVRCDGTATSPCPDATGSRACGTPAADYDEYHALVSIPIFQKGTLPYLDSGGDIDTTAPVRNEDVCVAVTVPKGTMPGAGWPVVVFGHGTGGSFRSHIRPEVAGALAKASTPMAVLGFDEVEHGPRRGGSTASPNLLFFNFKNPAAARGNPLQGAADVISMGRFAASIVIPTSVSGGANPIVADGSHVLYFGHSQGSMHGSVGLPYTSRYLAAVLSGNGASIAHALLSKTSPDNIAAALPFILGGDFDTNTGTLFGGDNHPVLSLIDQWIGPADPLNFAGSIARNPIAPQKAKSVFQPYGLGDTYSPPVTMQMYALAANLPVAAHDPSATTPDSIGGRTEQPVPLSGNAAPGGTTVTLAVREYKNATGKDGHFVVFDVPSANADAVRFLAGAAAGSVPVVGQ